MVNLARFTNAELIELSKDICYAVDSVGNEANYTILDDIENTIGQREEIDELTSVLIQEPLLNGAED